MCLHTKKNTDVIVFLQLRLPRGGGGRGRDPAKLYAKLATSFISESELCVVRDDFGGHPDSDD